MSKTLQSVATTAVYDDDFVRSPGMCQKFVRQCIQRLYGPKYDRYHKASARESALAWSFNQHAKVPTNGTKVGDIGYWTSAEHGEHGHTAIRVPGNKWAENSTVHRGNANGSKGFRSVAEMGTPQLIVRLPPKE